MSWSSLLRSPWASASRLAAAILVLSGALLIVMAIAPEASGQSEIDTARANARAAADAADEARQLAEEARARADAAVAELDLALGGLEEIEARSRVVQARATASEEELEALRVAVRDLTVRRYVVADETMAGAIIVGDIYQRVRVTTLFRFAVLGGEDEIDEFRIAEVEYARVSGELSELTAGQASAVELLDAKNEQLEIELATMEEQLEIAEAKEAEFGRELERLEEEERRRLAEERRRRLAEEQRRREAAARRAAEEAARRNNVPLIRGGDFKCPVGGATSFSDTWGAPRSGGRSHKGVDMFAARGTPVVASVAGVVRHRNSSLGGKSYYLAGDDGNTYYGAHLNTYGASGRVTAGTVVGTVGNTGNARFSSPHLHFEIHPNGGSAVNPTPTVRAACG